MSRFYKSSRFFLIIFCLNSYVEANFFSKFFKQTLPGLLAPKIDLWSKWEKNNDQDKKVISHEKWGIILKKYMVENHPSGIGRFKYSSVSKEDKALLSSYIKMMSALKITQYNSKEQKPYWINLYNALTVMVILDHYPVKSIRDIKIKKNHATFGPWDAKLLKIEGAEVSLNDIEHRILRPITKDPLVHYALNCASLGCPILRDRPFTSKNIEKLLENSASTFINHKRGVESAKGELKVSSIYIWFKNDFGKNDRDVIEHFKKYANDNLKRDLENNTNGISSHSYDWRINAP